MSCFWRSGFDATSRLSAGTCTSKPKKAGAGESTGKEKRPRKPEAFSISGTAKGLLPAGNARFTLGALARELAGAADRLGLFAGALLGGLLIEVPELHFAEHAFALKFLLQGLHRLVDVVIANEYLHGLILLLVQ